MVARTHEGAYVRHGRPGGPHFRRDVVDARSIDHDRPDEAFPTEDEELVHIRCIYAGGQGVVQNQAPGREASRC